MKRNNNLIILTLLFFSNFGFAQMAVAPTPVGTAAVTTVPPSGAVTVAAPGGVVTTTAVPAPAAAVTTTAVPAAPLSGLAAPPVEILPTDSTSIIPREDVNPPGAVAATDANSPTIMRLPPCPPLSSYPVPAGFRLAGISPSPSCQAAIIPMDDPNPFSNET